MLSFDILAGLPIWAFQVSHCVFRGEWETIIEKTENLYHYGKELELLNLLLTLLLTWVQINYPGDWIFICSYQVCCDWWSSLLQRSIRMSYCSYSQEASAALLTWYLIKKQLLFLMLMPSLCNSWSKQLFVSCIVYGSDPSFIFSTATSGNPREHCMVRFCTAVWLLLGEECL